jgi:hypothetical protein
MGDRPAKRKDPDVVLVHGRTEDGEGLRALRARAEGLSLAELRPLKEGRPLGACEIVRLSRREENPLLFDVQVQHEVADRELRAFAGPARVATRAYRNNWEAIFGAGAAGDADKGGGRPNRQRRR